RSLRNGGDVNRSSIEWEVEIDTTPPFVRAVTPYHYYSMGGTGVVVYQTAEDSTESGVRCGDQFYRGFRAKDRQGLWICFFPIPQEHTSKDRCQLYSKDRAGNETQTQFSYQIRPKKFRSDSITITEDFLKGIYPYFESIGIGNTQGQLVEWFKFINGKQREMDESKFSQMAKSTHEEALWEGVFLRMKDAAPMAGFGDRRSYKYGGQIIGDSVHKGVDLASLEHSPVEAANSGRVAFTGDLGIYGKTIILDHGQGIFSSYSHLSEIKVEVGQRISKGQVIGRTGKTGLAGGDHLHFGIMVQGVFVNPIEWWDPLWIREKISRWIEPEGKEATEAGPKEAGEGPGKKKPLRGKRS
ncbi:MAG: M23 family metallopeptidase, partial [Desulfatiglandales bacterium]